MAAGRARRLRLKQCEIECPTPSSGSRDNKRPPEAPSAALLSKQRRCHDEMCALSCPIACPIAVPLSVPGVPGNNCPQPSLCSGFEYTEVCCGTFVDFCTRSPVHQEDIIETSDQDHCEDRLENHGTVDPCSHRLDGKVFIEHEPCDAAYDEVCRGVFVDFVADSHICRDDITESMGSVLCEGRHDTKDTIDPIPSQLDESVPLNHERCTADSDEVRSCLHCDEGTVLGSAVDGGSPEAEFGTNDNFPFMVEASTTNRAKCRACRELIRAGSPRCGARVWFKVRWEVRWCHASCFLRGVGALYSKSGRRHCKATGRVFAPGDLEVRLGFGDPYTYSSWCPEAATRLTHAAAMMIGKSATCDATSGWMEANVGAGREPGMLGGFGAVSLEERDKLCKLLIPDNLPDPRSFHLALAAREASRLDLTNNDARLDLDDDEDQPILLDPDIVDDVVRPVFFGPHRKMCSNTAMEVRFENDK